MIFSSAICCHLLVYCLYSRDDVQVQTAEDFVRDVVMSIGDDLYDDGVGDMDFTYGSRLVFTAYIYK